MIVESPQSPDQPAWKVETPQVASLSHSLSHQRGLSTQLPPSAILSAGHGRTPSAATVALRIHKSSPAQSMPKEHILQHSSSSVSLASQKTTLANLPRAQLEKPFGEKWEHKKERIRKRSPFSSLDGWDVASVIYKAGDDLRGESE